MKTQNILDLIGNTPLIKTENLIKNKDITLYLKLEGNNPGGSVKDRPGIQYDQICFRQRRYQKNR